MAQIPRTGFRTTENRERGSARGDPNVAGLPNKLTENKRLKTMNNQQTSLSQSNRVNAEALARNYQKLRNRQNIVLPSKAVRPEEAYNLYRAGRKAGRVARFLGIPFNDTVDLLMEGQQLRHDSELKRAVADARRSVLARPAGRVN